MFRISVQTIKILVFLDKKYQIVVQRSVNLDYLAVEGMERLRI